MRKNAVIVLAIIVVIGLLAPAGAWAKRVTAGGSLTITTASVPLTTQLVVTAITSNPGLEKTIVQQLPLPGPLYVLPFFVNAEQGNPQSGDLNTILLVTNTSNGIVSFTVTLRGFDGNVLATFTPQALIGNETRVIQLSDLLP